MKKILLVDDYLHLIKIYERELRDKGFNDIRLATNGKEALEKILEDKPDIVLTDMAMPVMDGYELSKLIKEDPKTSDIYVIASSGGLFPKGIEDYADNFIQKGNIKKFMERLIEILGGK